MNKEAATEYSKVKDGMELDLLVKGISSFTTANDLMKHFQGGGTVIGAKVYHKSKTNIIGYVRMSSAEEALFCTRKFNRTLILGKIITITRVINEMSSKEGNNTEVDQQGNFEKPKVRKRLRRNEGKYRKRSSSYGGSDDNDRLEKRKYFSNVNNAHEERVSKYKSQQISNLGGMDIYSPTKDDLSERKYDQDYRQRSSSKVQWGYKPSPKSLTDILNRAENDSYEENSLKHKYQQVTILGEKDVNSPTKIDLTEKENDQYEYQQSSPKSAKVKGKRKVKRSPKSLTDILNRAGLDGDIAHCKNSHKAQKYNNASKSSVIIDCDSKSRSFNDDVNYVVIDERNVTSESDLNSERKSESKFKFTTQEKDWKENYYPQRNEIENQNNVLFCESNNMDDHKVSFDSSMKPSVSQSFPYNKDNSGWKENYYLQTNENKNNVLLHDSNNTDNRKISFDSSMKPSVSQSFLYNKDNSAVDTNTTITSDHIANKLIPLDPSSAAFRAGYEAALRNIDNIHF